jgi:hypothetical protein
MTTAEMIPPELSALYEWEFEDYPDRIELTLSFPLNFNPSQVRAYLSPDGTALSITIPGLLPIVYGLLLHPVFDMRAQISPQQSKYLIRKRNPASWPYLIDDCYPGTDCVDPASSFFLFQNLTGSGPIDENLINLLLVSANAGYRPALRLAFCLLLDDQSTADIARNFIRIDAERYGDPVGVFHYAVLLAKEGATRADALMYFRRAADLGIVEAKSLIGQILSPLSDVSFQNKNADDAATVLLEVMAEKPEEPVMCHELAMLYFNGIGVPKNVELALQLQATAATHMPNVAPLVERKVNPADGSLSEGFIGIAVVFGVLVILWTVWRKRR